jgi:hypothetical protein
MPRAVHVADGEEARCLQVANRDTSEGKIGQMGAVRLCVREYGGGRR